MLVSRVGLPAGGWPQLQTVYNVYLLKDMSPVLPSVYNVYLLGDMAPATGCIVIFGLTGPESVVLILWAGQEGDTSSPVTQRARAVGLR